MKKETCAIIGGGAAAASAAEAMRGEGFDGRILVLAGEHHPPYERPPLSKTFLRGEISKDKVTLRSAEFYAKNEIEVQLGNTVARIDPEQRIIESSGRQRIAYDKLLIASGAAPRRLGIKGDDLEHVYYLRTIDDCERIRSQLVRRPRVLVLGSGFIGCEVAASANLLGCNVTMLGRTLPLEHVLGREVGELYANYHRGRGVAIRTGVSAVEFRGSTSVQQVLLSDQSIVACDLVIAGIGVTPSLSFVPESMQITDGIATDEFCRTNLERIWAAGDVASSWRPRLARRVRFEHYDNAQRQGAAAAKSMLGKTQAYDPIPFFWSDQFDLHLNYYGFAAEWDSCVFRGRAQEYSFTAFYLRNERIEAVCNVNQFREIAPAKRLLGQQVPEQLLSDATSDLALLASTK